MNKEKEASLPVMESFFTIQGEGYNTGKSAYFIRLAGCDVGCHWCDVKESWEVSENQKKTIEDLILKIENYPVQNCVITGGEPLIYNLDELCDSLISKKINCWLETSGAYSLSGKWDWICLSPKKKMIPKSEILEQAHELKVIIYNTDDFKWAEQNALKVNKNCLLYLQPEWSVREKMIPKIIAYVKENPKWHISLQTHKYMNIP